MVDFHTPLRLGRSGAALAIAVFLAVFMIAAPVQAQTGGVNNGPLTLEKMAPDDIFAFVTLAGLKNCSAAAEDLGLYKLWKEPEVQGFLKQILEMYKEIAADAPPSAVEEWDRHKALFEGRISAIAGGLTVVWTREAPIPVPGVVIALDLGDRREVFRQMFDSLLDSDDLKHELRGVVRSTLDHHGHEVRVFSQERYFPQLSICTAFVENLFLVGLNQPLLLKCLDNLKGASTLADLPSFRRSRTKTGEKPLIEVFLNVDAFTSRVRGLIPEEWLGVLHSLGLDSIHAVYYASAVKDGDSLDTLYLDAPRPRRGLLNLGTRPISEKSLAFVPKHAAFFEIWHMNLAEAWDAVWKAMAQVVPPRHFKYVQRGLAEVERELGMKIRDGLLASLGEEAVVYAELRPNNMIPNVVLSIEIKDAVKANQVLNTALEMGGLKAREIPFGDRTLKVINLEEDVPFSPSYAFVENRLVFSLTPVGLKTALRRLDQARDSVLDSPDFQETFKVLDWKRSAYIGYFDTKRIVAFLYNMAENFSGLVDSEKVPLDLAMLPDVEVILKHMNGFGEVSYCDQDGVVYKARSIGGAVILGLLGRFLDKAPGIPPHVLERLGQRF